MNGVLTRQSITRLIMVTLYLMSVGVLTHPEAAFALGKSGPMEKGQPIPSVTAIGKNGEPVNLDALKGHVTLISIVPQLNTPVCDEQIHRFSEQNGDLDRKMTFVTLSTNTHNDQQTFATKADIHNMIFLSDAPDYQFGIKTGLLLEEFSVLHRAVVFLDINGIIRYVERVPQGQLPDFDQALRVSRSLLPTPPKE